MIILRSSQLLAYTRSSLRARKQPARRASCGRAGPTHRICSYIKVRPAAAGRASIEEEEGGLGVEEGGPNAGRAGRAGGAGGAGGASGTLVASG